MKLRPILYPDQVHLVLTGAPLLPYVPAAALLIGGRLFAGEWPTRIAPDAQAFLGPVWSVPLALLYEGALALSGFALLAWPFLTLSLHRARCLPGVTLPRRAVVFAAGLAVMLAAPSVLSSPWMRTLPLFDD